MELAWTNSIVAAGTPDPSHTNATASPTNRTYYDNFNPGTPFDIAMDCLLVLALVLAFYLLVVLTYHECFLHKTGISRTNKGAMICGVRIAPGLRILCILSAIFSLLRCINDIIYYKASAMSDIPCTVLKNMGVSWLIEVDTTVYLFLWLRQKVLYQKRSMKRLGNPVVSVSSWFALILIIAIFVVMNALLIWRKYHYVPEFASCKSIKNPVTDVIPRMWVVSSSVLHITLVVLYIYPLIRQTVKLNRKRSSALPTASNDVQGSSTMLNTQSTTTSGGQNSLMNVVRRCVIISSLCVITDGLAIAVTEHWLTRDEETKLRHFIYDINVVFNVFAIVCSFKKWRLMLFPWICREDKNDKSNSPKRDCQSTTTTINANVIHRVST